MDRRALVHVLSNKIGAAFPSNQELNPLGVLCALSLQALNDEQLRSVDGKLRSFCGISAKELAGNDLTDFMSAERAESSHKSPDLDMPDISEVYGTPNDPKSRRAADSIAQEALQEIVTSLLPADVERSRIMSQLVIELINQEFVNFPYSLRCEVLRRTGMTLEDAIQKMRE